MKLYITKLKEGICIIRTLKQQDIARMFMRPAEYYENPVHQGKLGTTVKQIQAWQKKQSKGKYCYEDVWAGFNMPAKVWEEWHSGSVQLCGQGKFSFNRYEKELIKALLGNKSELDSIAYIIGVYGGEKSKWMKATLMHEIAHALYYTSKEYKRNSIKLLKTIPLSFRKEAFKVLAKMGYASSVLNDELQAYLSTGLGRKLRKVFKDTKFESEFKGYFNKKKVLDK